MYDTLTSQLNDAMSREGKSLTTLSDNATHSVLFRKNSDKNQFDNRVTIFYGASESIAQGQLVQYGTTYYIVMNQETVENSVYKKSDLLQVNTELRTIANGYEICLKAYAQDMTSVEVDGNASLSIVGGNVEFITEDNATSRNITTNCTFDALGGSWNVINTIYKSGLYYIYTERCSGEVFTPSYALSITAAQSYNVEDTATLTTTATMTQGDTTTTIQNPTITWASSDDSVLTVTRCIKGEYTPRQITRL